MDFFNWLQRWKGEIRNCRFADEGGNGQTFLPAVGKIFQTESFVVNFAPISVVDQDSTVLQELHLSVEGQQAERVRTHFEEFSGKQFSRVHL